MSTKILGKNSFDIPNLEIWVKLLYNVLPYKTRRALRDKHDSYLLEHLPEWAGWKERDKDILDNTLLYPEIVPEEGILIDTGSSKKKSRAKAKKEKKAHKHKKPPIKKEPRRKKNDERLFLSQL
jgi:hypothetical protein